MKSLERCVIIFYIFSVHSEGKNCVVISEDGHTVDYKSGKDGVKNCHCHHLPFNYLLSASSECCVCFFKQETKSFLFDQVVNVDNIQVQKTF